MSAAGNGKTASPAAPPVELRELAMFLALLAPARCHRPGDCRGIWIKARTHAKEQAGSEDEDRPGRRIRARRVGTARKAVARMHLANLRGSEKLAPGCRHATRRAAGSELSAGPTRGFECGGLGVDPRAREIDPAPSSARVGEARHPMRAHAIRQLQRRRGVSRATAIDRLLRVPAGGEHERTAQGSDAAPQLPSLELSHVVAVVRVAA